MDLWRCCRMCLSNSDLNPIFLVQEYHEKYSDVLFAVTGIKVSTTDRLSQLICTNCVKITNESYKYRKKAQETQQILTENLSNAPETEIKLENKVINTEKYISIDISDLVDNFHDFEDATSNFSENIDKNTEILTENEQNNTAIEDKSLKKDKVKRKVKRKTKKVSDDVKTNEVPKTGEVPKTNEVPEMKEVINVSVETKGSEKKGERIKEAIECQYCHKILTSKLSLRNHYKIHTGFDIVCEHCGKKFITRRLLLMHCKAKHGYEKTDKCSYCDYKASNAEQVKIHERLHTGEKPYVCGECGAGFHRKSSYLQHVAIHLPEKTVECEVCGAGFKSVTLMRIHLSRHRAPRHVFSCRECGLTFARRRNVARHLQRIHALRPDDAYIARTQCG